MTTTKEKTPEFNVGLSSIDSSLKTLVHYQHTNISGVEKTTNNKITTEIQIKIINGINLPTEKTDLESLAKRIASQIKQEVKNQNDFKNYRVFFVEQSKGAIGAVNKWKSWVFKSEEL